MGKQVFVFDPTATDEQSRVRGVGRYLQILKENFPEFNFTSDLKTIPFESVFINPFFNLLQPPLITKRIAQKQIAIIHDVIPLTYPSHFPKGIRGTINVLRNKQALKHYDTIVTDSNTSKKNIERKLQVTSYKLQVIYPTLPKIFFENKIQISKSKTQINPKFQMPNPPVGEAGTKYYVYVGDVTWNKNLVNIAKAVKIADVTCVFVGKAFQNSSSSVHPWLKEFNEFKKEVENDKRFIFPGFVSDEELIQLYQNAVANILVSRDEGFGFSYLEAAVCQTPSVLSITPVFQEIAQNHALFRHAEDPKEIADGIKHYQDDHIRKTISKDSKERSKAFSPEQFKKKWNEVTSSLS
ncbi:MAG: glycosyltransferase [Patescibacteria group bacterium]